MRNAFQCLCQGQANNNGTAVSPSVPFRTVKVLTDSRMSSCKRNQGRSFRTDHTSAVPTPPQPSLRPGRWGPEWPARGWSGGGRAPGPWSWRSLNGVQRWWRARPGRRRKSSRRPWQRSFWEEDGGDVKSYCRGLSVNLCFACCTAASNSGSLELQRGGRTARGSVSQWGAAGG